MPVVIDGTNGITTPDVESTGPITGTTGAFSGNVTANGLTTELRPLVLGASQASTSGTAIDFTGIPSWVKRITVMFSTVSVSGAAQVLVRIGSSSGFAASGYTSSGGSSGGAGTGGTTATDGFVIFVNGAASNFTGFMTIANITGNVWTSAHHMGLTSTSNFLVGGGLVTLPGALDRIRITSTSGTDTFDLGTINIMYE